MWRDQPQDLLTDAGYVGEEVEDTYAEADVT